MKQIPAPGEYVLGWDGDELAVSLDLGEARRGRAVFRTEIGGAVIARREVIEKNERGVTPLEKDWQDIPMAETAPGVWRCTVPLDEVGIFAGKCCFFPEGGSAPEWPEGGNLVVKVCPDEARRRNAIYTVFPRQFGSFRAVARKLDFILGEMGFDIVQTLPPFPVPTTYAVMGEYGCPFASTDFFSVDPAMAEFDEAATPLDQFRELIGAVHARGGRLFLDLPANHTGWASALQTHHPEWFRREPDGRFHSPGAWGVIWADLVELDYAHHELRAYMADVFLFWARKGVDGFRCDAGYMIPEETWEYIVARVREEYPDTVFMLEGLGGKLEVTDALLNRAGLDWAYSEIFQTYDRGAFEWYLPGAIDRARRYGTLVHFAETHDNDRLAKGGTAWARLRVALAALLSHQGAWGIANGVEWYATEKIDVHGKNDLNWGAAENMTDLIARLNRLLATHPDFLEPAHRVLHGGADAPFELVECGAGNFLAVRRGGTLILANLDCGSGVTAHWDVHRCAPGKYYDLLEDREVSLDGEYRLGPGEFHAFSMRRCGSAETDPPAGGPADGAAAVTWRYPEDVNRDVPVPDGMPIRIVSAHPFRARLQDGERTLAVKRGAPDGEGRFSALLAPPAYAGDGTGCDVREIAFTDYGPRGARGAPPTGAGPAERCARGAPPTGAGPAERWGTASSPSRVVRTRSRVFIAPSADKAAMKTVYTGAEIRRNLVRPDEGGLLETVLSDGAGSSARVKLAWGEVRSQYDALLAANPNPNVPADRLTLWTRCRCWLQHEGYSREINTDCIDFFRADPAGRAAEWFFTVPCGLGRVAKFRFCLRLAQSGTGSAVLEVQRLEASKQDEVGPVTLVFRPDLEWRSFHGTTKAQGAVENAFAGATWEPGRSGFAFAPYGRDEQLVMAIAGGEFHQEGEWSYCVSHAEEAERGQDGCGDLYSPGWMSCSFDVGFTTALTAAYVSTARVKAFDEEESKRLFAERGESAGNPVAEIPLDEALREALKLFIVKRDDVKTVIAGYPWFLDWGRDTFIFLQGAIPAGFRREALEIAEAFARFEENGTLPNIIYGEKAGNRDTTDAPLWFIRTLAVLGRDGEPFRATAENIVARYISGTPNGIRMDPESGLVWSPSHFTWMDTNYPACTPRCGYPVEIQALWIAALRYTGRTELADRAARSLVRYFARADETGGLCDCLDAPDGESAAQARPDASVRPNQLFVLALGALDSLEGPEVRELERSVLGACARLLVPGGVRSLDARDGKYRGVYAGDEDTSRKPAYHNGTVWAWPMPVFAEAAVACGALTAEQGLSLLAACVANLNAGCVCQISEIADGDAPHAQKGCRAQAWSASEFFRVWHLLQEARR